MPPYCLVVDWSAWANASNRAAACAASIPTPVSDTAKMNPVAVLAGDAYRHLAGGRELDGVREQIQQDLTQPRTVAVDGNRHVGVDPVIDLKALGVRLVGEHLAGFLDGAPQVEVGAIELEKSGFDLREVEHVVDDPQERLTGGPQRIEVLLWTGSKRGVSQQLRHADDSVQRRAYLVAHAGDELRLQARGLERLGTRA